MAKKERPLSASDLALVEKAEAIIGYKFQDPRLLKTALTHPSASKTKCVDDNYERLEFLGDSVLGFIIAQEVFNRFPDLEEGGLTRIKVSLVSGASLSRIAEEQGLREVIVLGDSEMGTRGRGMHSALENVFEAVVAALFLDGGLEIATEWSLRVLGPYISKDIASEPESPKSSLQEILQARRKKPVYDIVEIAGPPHERTFTAVVKCEDEEIGRGEGHSKKAAEAAAAAKALESLKH